MSDQGFDFQPPPRHRARRFEPPPWEREAFERFSQQEAERQAAIAEAQRQESDVDGAEASEPGPSTPAGPEAASAPADTVTEAPRAKLDEKQVAEMMVELKADEPPALPHAWLVSAASGAVVVLIGLIVAVWGTAALARGRTGAIAAAAGAVLLLFGIGFSAVGGWMVFKALRQRGVL